MGATSPETQRKILVGLLKSRGDALQTLLGQVEPLEEAGKREQIQERISEELWILRAVEPQVPPGAIFIGLIPPVSEPGERLFVDDWALIEREARRNPKFRGIVLHRYPLIPGENLVEQVRKITQELGYLAQGRQHTVAIALPVLSEEEAQSLERFWAERPTTEDPNLFFSFHYIPRSHIQRQSVASFVPLFENWANGKIFGIHTVEPHLALPPELRRLFEERINAQAGLEQAA
jgi:hypothetical protein